MSKQPKELVVKACVAWAVPDWKGNIADVFFKPQSPERYHEVHIAPTATHAVVRRNAVDILQHVVDPKRPDFAEGVRYALAFLGFNLPVKKAAKCRTCKGTGLANSGVPSMPMPCPKCKPAKCNRKKGRGR